MAESPYRMTLSLNLLNHLGINLYSNVPAVLSEAVANAWDADAEHVFINIDKDDGTISITDDGHGMDLNDVNNKYLTVGYRRRDEPNGGVTETLGRAVMGRKGIGKLSLFSISRDISIFTIKNGERHAFRLLVDEIQKKIENNEGEYRPTALTKFPKDLKEGTRIVLADLKKSLGQTESALRKRLARRFSILGKKHRFSLKINQREVTVADRAYFPKLQYLWHYGPEEDLPLDEAKNLTHHENRANVVKVAEARKGKKPKLSTYRVNGWIGTVKESGHLADDDDNLNKVVIMEIGRAHV